MGRQSELIQLLENENQTAFYHIQNSQDQLS